MNRKILYLILALSIIWILGGCAYSTEVGKIDADSIIGVWADKDQKYVYAFLENSKFKFWVFRDRLQKTQGVWKMDANFWDESLRAKKEKIEELYIYTSTIQCCMSPRFSRNKLMLKKVWMHEMAFMPDVLDVCSDKVLTKIEKMPRE